MMNIYVLCVGNIREKALKELSNEYEKRLSKYCKLQIIELKEEVLPDKLTEGNTYMIKEKEAKQIKDRIAKISNPYVIALDETGEMLSSRELSNKIQTIATNGFSNIVFVIGGSLGLEPTFAKNANMKLSFSRLTFPHQLFRVFLLEQIFRSFKISNNETYHH